MRKTVNKRPFNSAIRLPRIDLEYPILSPPSLRPLKVQKEVKCNPKQQNPPRVLISDDSSHQQPHQDNYFVNGSATDDESDGSITVMSSHSDIFLQNSGLSLIKSYIYDIGFENDKDCSDIDPLSPIGSRIEEVSKSIGYDLEADSEVKLEYVEASSVQQMAPPLDFKFNNLSSWKPTSLNPKVQLIRFKLTQDIMYRERLLVQLGGMVKNLDKRYWKYSVLRIRTAEDNKSLNSEDLVSKRNRMVVIQSEISALIAHIRSLSLSVVDSILKLRYTIRKEYETTDELSVYFKHQNYLLKIGNDLKDIFESSVEQMHYWLGFDPNTFMVPPESEGVEPFDMNSNGSVRWGQSLHNPKAVWQHDIVEGVYMQWFRAHCERMAKEIKMDKANRRKFKHAAVRKVAVTTTGTVHIATSSIIPPNLPVTTHEQPTQIISNNVHVNDSSLEEGSSEIRHDSESVNTTVTEIETNIAESSSSSQHVNDKTESPMNELYSNEVLSAPEPMDFKIIDNVIPQLSLFDIVPGNSTHSLSQNQSSPKIPQMNNLATKITSPQSKDVEKAKEASEEWQLLREYAAISWGFSVKTGLRGQGRDCAPQFWCNFDQNPFVVESIVGFAEVFPELTMVPTVPDELRMKCALAKELIEWEVQSVERVAKLKDEAELTKASFLELYSHMGEKLSMIMGSTESVGAESATENIGSNHQEELRNLKLRQQGNSQLLTGISTEYLESGSAVALAVSSALGRQSTVINKKSKEVNYLGKFVENSVDSYVFMTEPANLSNSNFIGAESLEEKSFKTDANYHDHFKSNILNTSSLQFFRVENSKTSKVIEDKVMDSRRMIELGEDVVPRVRESCKGKRQLNRLSEQYLRFIVVTIQRWIRGFLGRRRFKYAWRHANSFRCLVCLQSHLRGMLGRRLAKMKAHQRRVEIFSLRKSLVRRHRSALLLTNFIRQVINKKRIKNNLPLMKLTITPSVLKNSSRKKKKQKGYESSLSSSHTLTKAESITENPVHFGEPKSRQPKLATDDDDDRSQSSAVSQAVSEKSLHSYSSSKSALSVDSALREEIAMENEVSNLLTIDDEVERRKWQKLRAIQLVQKVNCGRFIKDTVYTSRLIPMKEIRNSTSSIKIKLFSVKEHAFLSTPSPLVQSSSTSVLSNDSTRLHRNSSDVYESGNSFHKIARSSKLLAKLPSPIPPISQDTRNDSNCLPGESKISSLLREHKLIKRTVLQKGSSVFSIGSEPHLITGNSVILSEVDVRDTLSSVGIRSTDSVAQLAFLKKYI